MHDNLSNRLAGHPLFGALPHSALTRLLNVSFVVKHPPNSILFSKGDRAESVFIVLEGEISIEVMSLDGRMANIAILTPLDILGEFTVLDDGRRSTNARSLTNLKMLSISKPQFLRLVADHPDFSMRLIRLLIQRLRDSDVLIESISLLSLKQRTSQLLLRLADTAPTIKITQVQLAERLSASREKINGHLGSLQDAGAIKLRRGAIDIINIDILKKTVETD